MEVTLQRIFGDHAKKINFMMQDKELISTFKDCNLFRHREIQIGDQMTCLIELIKNIEPTVHTDTSKVKSFSKTKKSS